MGFSLGHFIEFDCFNLAMFLGESFLEWHWQSPRETVYQWTEIKKTKWKKFHFPTDNKHDKKPGNKVTWIYSYNVSCKVDKYIVNKIMALTKKNLPVIVSCSENLAHLVKINTLRPICMHYLTGVYAILNLSKACHEWTTQIEPFI